MEGSCPFVCWQNWVNQSTLSNLHIFWASKSPSPPSLNRADGETCEEFLLGKLWWKQEDAYSLLGCDTETSWAWWSGNKVDQTNCRGRPVEHGGLGIMLIKQIAEAALQRQCWFIGSRKKSLRVEWVHKKYIKAKNLWNRKTNWNSSWVL